MRNSIFILLSLLLISSFSAFSQKSSVNYDKTRTYTKYTFPVYGYDSDSQYLELEKTFKTKDGIIYAIFDKKERNYSIIARDDVKIKDLIDVARGMHSKVDEYSSNPILPKQLDKLLNETK